MWSSEKANTPSAGFSLTEVLVVLAILALAVAVFATSRPGPSPALRLEARATDVISQSAQTHAQAIRAMQTQTLGIGGPLCAKSDEILKFFADGTALPAQVCLTDGARQVTLVLDPLTGRLTRGDAP